jgi:hypothetical protein
MKFPLPLGLVLAIGFSVPVLSAPTPTPSPSAAPSRPGAGSLEVIATDGGGTERHLVSQNGRVGQLVINQNQAVSVTLQFPSDKAGMPVVVSSLDGGEITGDDHPTVLPNGKVHLVFHSGAAPGLYRVVVRLPAESHRLEFYVIDPSHPRNPRLRPPS